MFIFLLIEIPKVWWKKTLVNCITRGALSSAFLLLISCKWHKCWSEIQENFGKITLLAVWLYCCFTCMNALLCCRDSRSIGVCFVAWWNQPVLFVSQCLTDYIFCQWPATSMGQQVSWTVICLASALFTRYVTKKVWLKLRSKE